jgi:hypothetical protein
LKSAGKEALLQSACQAFFDAMIATTRDPYGYPRLDISIADTLVELHCDSLLLLGIVAETASDYRFDAETVAARIPDPLMRDHAYEIIIADQCQKEHEYLFVQDLVNKIKDGDTRGKALSELAEAFARDGDITEAIKARNKIPTDYWKMLTDSKLAPIQAKSGDVSGAIQRAMNISSDTPAATQTWKSVALESVVRAVADKGNYAIALETAGKLKGALSKDQALIIVLKAQAKKGDTAAATKTCGLLVDPTYKASGDVEIARALCRAGNRAEGLKVAASVATRIEQIKSESDRKDALSSLAVIQASAGDSAGALAVVGQIQDDNDRWNATIKVLDAAMAQRDRAGADAAIKQLEALAATEQPGRYYRRAEVASRKLELGETTSASSTIAAIANRDDRIAASSAAIMYTLKRAAEGSKLTGK